MASRLTVEPATEAHGELLAKHLRPEDADEMMASHGVAPEEGVRLALRHSTKAWAILDGARVVALFGVNEVAEATASVWMLAARLVKRLPLAFMRTVAREVKRLQAEWSLLFNMVWTRNESALRWVRAVGFEVLRPEPFGVRGLQFHPILLKGS